MKLLQKTRRWLAKALVQDGDHGGWIDTNAPWNYWQTGHTAYGGKNSVVHACVQAYAQTIAQLPARHVRKDSSGYDDDVSGSNVVRVMHRPNNYQTRSDFLLNLVYSLMYEGNAYAVGERSGYEINALHLVPPSACTASVVDGEIFYHVAPQEPSGMPAVIAPARDVLHVKLHTPNDPLRGETPIYAAALAIKTNNNIMGHQSKFFENMSRPSGVLSTQEKLTGEQMATLRQKWEEMSSGLSSGKVPVLGWGMKWESMSLNAVDAQLIDALRFSVEDIARAYRVPLPLIGDLKEATYANVNNLMNFWKASGLGFVLEHIEQALAVLFNLPVNERIELDTNTLMRTDLAARIDALTTGITGGLYSPNEARQKEGLRPVAGGEQPRVQQQMVPLDFEPPAPQPAPEPEPDEDELVRQYREMMYG